jgi:type I restriction enzyme S subunit
MKRYPAYKDSGIEWIGEIPEHWEVKPIKYVGEIVLGKMLTPDDKGGYFRKPYLRAQNITWEKTDTEDIKEMWFSEKDLSQYRLKENDLLVSEGGEVGRTAIWQNELSECYIQNSVHKITIKSKNNPHYYLYHFQIYGKTGYFDSIVNRVSIAHLTREKLKEIMFLAPTLSEQQTIANYLDRKTHQIDTLIENKQKQIDLLKEQRAAIINQAVTKGLNSNVKLKDSGIEWLGEIPEGWKPVKLKFLTSKIGSGVTPRGGSEVYQETGVPLLRSQNIYSDRLRLDEVAYISQEIHDSMNSSKVQHNDVLLNITGASIGRCYYVTEEFGEANVNQHVCIIRPNERIKTIFLFNVLASTIGQFQVLNGQNGTSREGLNFEELGNFIIPLPPKTEQIKVIEFLDRASSKIFTSIDNLNNQMDLLQEYRTTLISEVVTGKIDVRDSGEQEVRPS